MFEMGAISPARRLDPGAMENWDAAGRWLASSVDMMRFVAGIEGSPGTRLCWRLPRSRR